MTIEVIANEAEIRSSANTFFEAGMQKFDAGNFQDAKQYLSWAGRLFRKLGDDFYVRILRSWYEPTSTRLGITEQQEWYYPPSR